MLPRIAITVGDPAGIGPEIAAKVPWKGHTDLLAHLCGSERYAMLFYSPGLVVALATVHVPLADVPRLLTRERVADVTTLTGEWLTRFGVAHPRVACLNPHAGESGC